MLYFDVEANWKNFQRIREEIEKLKTAMSDMSLDDTQMEECAKKMQRLQEQLDSLTVKAAEAGDAFRQAFVDQISGGQEILSKYGTMVDNVTGKVSNLASTISKANNEQSKITPFSESTAKQFDAQRYEQINAETAESIEEIQKNSEGAINSLMELMSGLEDESEATEAELERLTEALSEYEKAAEKAAEKGDRTDAEVMNLQVANIKQGIEDAKQNLEVIEQTKEALKEQSTAYTENYSQVAETGAKLKYLRQEIEQTITALKEMEAAGKANTTEYQYLQQKLNDLSASYEQVAEGVKKFTRDAGELPSASGNFSEFSDEVKEGVDAVAKLTGKNTELTGILTRIKSVLATTTKLQGVANTQTTDATKKQGALGNALSIVSGKLVANISGIRGAASAVRVLTAALSTGPLIVITAVIAVLAKLVSMWQKTRKEQQEFYKDVANAAAKPIASFNKLKTEWNALSLDEKEQYIKKNAKAFDELGMSIKNVADAERMLNELDKEFVNLQMLKAKSAAYAKQAEEKTNEYAQKNIKQQSRIEDEQWGNAEKAIERLEKQRKTAWLTGNVGGALVFTKQIKDAREAMEKGEEYWTLYQKMVSETNKKQQEELAKEIKVRNEKAAEAEKQYKELAKQLGIDTGEVEVDSVAYYKQEISRLNKELEKQTDKTGEEVEKIKQQIQDYQNEIDKITGADKVRRQKLADDMEKSELNNQKRLISIQQKGVQKQISLIDNEYKQKKAEYDRQQRDLADKLGKGEISGTEFYERSNQIDSDWDVTQKELQKKRSDVFKAEAERQLNFQDELDKLTLSGQKRNLQLQRDGINKQLALIDLEYQEKINEYEKQERELEKQRKEGRITQEEYFKKSTLIGYQKNSLAVWEADKQKTDVIDSMLNNYKDYTQKKLDIDKKYEEDKANLQEVIESEWATEEQKEQAKRAQVKLEENRNKEQLDLGMQELKEGKEWQLVFQNLNNYGQTTLNNLKKKLVELGDSVTENMNPADLQAYNDALQRLNERLMDFQPREALENATVNLDEKKQNLFGAQAAVKQAQAMKEAAKTQREKEQATRAEAVAQEWLKDAENEAAQAQEQYNTAAEKFQSHTEKMVAPVQNLANQISNLGQQVDGIAGDILQTVGTVADATVTCIQSFVSLATSSTKTIEGTSETTSKAIAATEKASVILAIISAVLQVAQAIDKLIDKKNSAADEKAKDIAKMQGAVNDYRMAVLKAQQAEKGWFNASGMDKLQESYERSQQALKNYYDTAYAMQEKYVDKQGGGILKTIGDWGSKIATLPGELIGKGLEQLGVEGAANVTKWVDPFATAAEKVINKVQDNETNKDFFDNIKEFQDKQYSDKVRAIDNLRIITQEKKDGFWGIGSKNEKTQNLQSWLKENGFEGELFDDNQLINLQAADMILNNFGDKLTDQTKITIEELKQAREDYDQYLENLHSFVSEMFGGITDSMVDSLFNWLETGEDVMDTFEQSAKDTFKAIAKDMTKTLINKMVMDGYADKIAENYDKFYKGDMSAEELTKAIGDESAALKNKYENALPVLKQAVEGMSDVFEFIGDSTNQQSAVAGAFQTMSEDTAGVLEGRFTAVYESNLAIQGTLAGIGDEVSRMANTVVANYQTVSDIRNIVVDSNLHLQAIADSTAKIEKLCTNISDSAYKTMQNTANL